MPENWIIDTCQCRDTHTDHNGRTWVGVTFHSMNCGKVKQ